MSSFMVSDDTINRVVTCLAHKDRRRMMEMVLEAVEIWNDADAPSRLGQAMKDLNHDALLCRYGESCSTHYRFKLENCSDIQAVKSLACWLYQCAEGDVPERSLYLALQEIKGELSYQILREMDIYENAKWD